MERYAGAGTYAGILYFPFRSRKMTPPASLYPIVAKAGGLQSQGAKGEAVVNLLRTLGNAGSGVLRLSAG